MTPKIKSTMRIELESFEEYVTMRAALLYYWDFATRSPLADIRARAEICMTGVKLLDGLAEKNFEVGGTPR